MKHAILAATVLVTAAASACTGTPAERRGDATDATVAASPSTQGGSEQPSFDTCAALDESFRRAHDLDGVEPSPFSDHVDGYAWSGCTYTTSRFVGIQIGVTNIAIDSVISRHFAAATEIRIDGRRAVHYDPAPDKHDQCALYIDLDGGSLYIELLVTTANFAQGISPCQQAIETANAVEPLLPN